MYFNKGKTTKQAHVDIPEGTFEEQHGREGFFGPVSHLYHNHPPTGWTRIEGPCRPRAFNTNPLAEQAPNSFTPLLYNDEVEMSVAFANTSPDFFSRNGDGDEVWFAHRGGGVLETDYGMLPFSQGDYLVIPRGTTYRFDVSSPCTFLVIEARGTRLEQPSRGIVGQYSLYDVTAMRSPEIVKLSSSKAEYEVRIKREGDFTSVYYPFHPLDIAGWKGDLYPWALNIADFCPILSHRAHLPPSVHTTLVGKGFVICSFVPRPLEEALGAQRVPFYHRNIDYDEVLFYHDGDFFSRDGISAGM
ncbi:MAG: homogentisate 1,2-dioxygenase, partial [Blastocatellia bacterium]|nr:homogentisate 1,2-dioxygenase [Blastocatellia bacterium]